MTVQTPEPLRRTGNRLLGMLPEEDYRQLAPSLTIIHAQRKHIFYHSGEPLTSVYFPEGGVTSVTAMLSDGTAVETGTIGREGMLGIEAFFGEDPISQGESMMQVSEADLAQLPATVFRAEMARQGALFRLVARYAQAALFQAMQSVACNARHDIYERCARWLLSTQDRIERDVFDLSHEFLAAMLGVRRQSVTVAAGALQKAGFILYTYGHVEIRDREGLAGAACECYEMVRQRFVALTADSFRGG